MWDVLGVDGGGYFSGYLCGLGVKVVWQYFVVEFYL